METQPDRVAEALLERIRSIPLTLKFRRTRYAVGDMLRLHFRTAWPEREGHGCFLIEAFVGGGYAGQVYRCRLESVSVEAGEADALGLIPQRVYAVKILIPPSRVAARFRDFIYRIGFQSAFSPQTNEAACRTGLLWPKVLRLAARFIYGRADAVADTYASFFDPELRSWGEIREWVEGRQWRLETDHRLAVRRQWRTIDPVLTDSPEYIAKRQFMDRLVGMMRQMGAAELARQYVWWTMKSQPNVLRRSAAGGLPGDGLCAVDFRAGLALLPLLPMSPADIGLIIGGIRRGSWVQFDRYDYARIRTFFASHFASSGGLPDDVAALLQALECADREYRDSMPDLTHQGLRLLGDRNLRGAVRKGLVDGWYSAGLIDESARQRLAEGRGFLRFWLLGCVPFAGRMLRRVMGDAAYRRHLGQMLSSWAYVRQCGRVAAAVAALNWKRARRVSDAHALQVADCIGLFWVERLSLSWLPRPVHRVMTDPALPLRAAASGWRYVKRFLSEPRFRETWLRDQIDEGYREGMLTDSERAAVEARLADPFIARYLKCIGVHLAIIPVTQVVSLTVGLLVAARVYMVTADRLLAGGALLGVLAVFQVFPISPGSICRGLYVVYLMLRERNWRDYVVAAPLSFVKYVGYLAFPLQMTTVYPELAQYLAGRWATRAVRVVPVFGERGSLFEHLVFDLCFNVTHAVGRGLSRHARGVLNGWLALGTLLFMAGLLLRMDWVLLFELAGDRAVSTGHARELQRFVNLALAYVGVFLLPRILFYPVLRARRCG